MTSFTRRAHLILLACLFSLSFARVAHSDKGQLTIEVHSNDVVVSQATPGTDIFIFSMSQVPSAYYTRFVPFETTVTDNDHDGIVKVDISQAISLRSVWVAIDLKSGEMAAGTPAGFSLDLAELPTTCFKKGPGNLLTSFELDRHTLEFVLIRPGKGVWRYTVSQGGSADEGGGKDGKLSMSPGHMRKSSDSSGPAPDSFSGGDTLVTIDPFSLQVLSSRLPQ